VTLEVCNRRKWNEKSASRGVGWGGVGGGGVM
jgi:hypothetical protein